MLPTEPIFSSQSQCFDQYFLCFLICAISPRVGWTTRSNPTSIALIGRLGTLKAPNKGCQSTPEFRLKSVNPLICYQELTTPHQIHKIPTCNWRSKDTNNPRQYGKDYKISRCSVDASWGKQGKITSARSERQNSWTENCLSSESSFSSFSSLCMSLGWWEDCPTDQIIPI